MKKFILVDDLQPSAKLGSTWHAKCLTTETIFVLSIDCAAFRLQKRRPGSHHRRALHKGALILGYKPLLAFKRSRSAVDKFLSTSALLLIEFRTSARTVRQEIKPFLVR